MFSNTFPTVKDGFNLKLLNQKCDFVISYRRVKSAMNYCLQQIRTDTDQYAKPLCCLVCCLPRPCRAAARCLQQYRTVLVNTKWIFTQEL